MRSLLLSHTSAPPLCALVYVAAVAFLPAACSRELVPIRDGIRVSTDVPIQEIDVGSSSVRVAWAGLTRARNGYSINPYDYDLATATSYASADPGDVPRSTRCNLLPGISTSGTDTAYPSGSNYSVTEYMEIEDSTTVHSFSLGRDAPEARVVLVPRSGGPAVVSLRADAAPTADLGAAIPLIVPDEPFWFDCSGLGGVVRALQLYRVTGRSMLEAGVYLSDRSLGTPYETFLVLASHGDPLGCPGARVTGGEGESVEMPITLPPGEQWVLDVLFDECSSEAIPLVLASEADSHGSPPLAEASARPLARLGETVVLDGSASHDDDGRQLRFEWSILEQPVGSVAELRRPTASIAELDPDVPGSWTFELVVYAGADESEPLEVSVEVADLGYADRLVPGEVYVWGVTGSRGRNGFAHWSRMDVTTHLNQWASEPMALWHPGTVQIHPLTGELLIPGSSGANGGAEDAIDAFVAGADCDLYADGTTGGLTAGGTRQSRRVANPCIEHQSLGPFLLDPDDGSMWVRCGDGGATTWYDETGEVRVAGYSIAQLGHGPTALLVEWGSATGILNTSTLATTPVVGLPPLKVLDTRSRTDGSYWVLLTEIPASSALRSLWIVNPDGSTSLVGEYPDTPEGVFGGTSDLLGGTLDAEARLLSIHKEDQTPYDEVLVLRTLDGESRVVASWSATAESPIAEIGHDMFITGP